MDDLDRFVDANESYNNIPKRSHLWAYFKEFWLAIVTCLACVLAIVQGSCIKLNLDKETGVPLLMLPANFFLRHVRGFVVLFIIFSAATKTALLFETKRSTVKRKILFHYFLNTSLTLFVSFVAAYLIIMRRDSSSQTKFFAKFVNESYRPLTNFVRFFRGLAIHDIPGNIITTRVENYNELGAQKLEGGLGDGYNAPGFVVFGAFLACSTYFLGKDGEILRNLMQLIHRSMLAVYWILLCYSPLALYFAGIVQYDLVQQEGMLGFLSLRYLLLLACVCLVTLLQIFILLPFLHFCRTRKFGYEVISRLFAIMPNAFVGGSSVRMVEKTKMYLKSKRFSVESVDTYLNYCTLINGSGIASGFVINAIFSLKLYDADFDWAVIFKIVLTGLLVSLAVPEFIQGYMFGIIFFLNTSMINPDFIVLILLVDWLMDRFRVVANVVADALTVDYIESISKSSTATTQSL
uniref:Amino acid transporter n=1 Tax=Theileria annulata TaxID=5874 RepID=A0A3B0MYW6_THEAN